LDLEEKSARPHKWHRSKIKGRELTGFFLKFKASYIEIKSGK